MSKRREVAKTARAAMYEAQCLRTELVLFGEAVEHYSNGRSGEAFRDVLRDSVGAFQAMRRDISTLQERLKVLTTARKGMTTLKEEDEVWNGKKAYKMKRSAKAEGNKVREQARAKNFFTAGEETSPPSPRARSKNSPSSGRGKPATTQQGSTAGKKSKKSKTS